MLIKEHGSFAKIGCNVTRCRAYVAVSCKNRAPKKERGSFFVSLIYLFDKSLIWFWCTQEP